jgi:hypothetical protein
MFRGGKLWKIHDGAVQLAGSRQCSTYDSVMMPCHWVADRPRFSVLLKTDLERTSPSRAPAPSPKAIYFVTVYRRLIGNKHLGRE